VRKLVVAGIGQNGLGDTRGGPIRWQRQRQRQTLGAPEHDEHGLGHRAMRAIIRVDMAEPHQLQDQFAQQRRDHESQRPGRQRRAPRGRNIQRP
jgi:hypothetical protein